MNQRHWYYVNSAALLPSTALMSRPFKNVTLKAMHTLAQKINGKSLRQMAIQDRQQTLIIMDHQLSH